MNDATPQSSHADSDKLATSVFAIGLMDGFIAREDVVRWADRRIEQMEHPPEWLIDLSLSQNTHLMDLISSLRRLSENIDPVATCEAIYALLPDVASYSFDEAAAFCRKLYRITYDCLKGDWKQEFLSITDNLADDFEFLRDGYLASTESDVIAAVQKFVQEFRDEQIAQLLRPVHWSWQPDVDPKEPANANVELIHVGLASWIIQDGNYGDFSVGDVAKFALEFHPLHESNSGGLRTPKAEYVKASRYKVSGQVIFAHPAVWVIDTGRFRAYKEEENTRVVGDWLEGEIYLGIDPFFYFERLHSLDEMPALTYSWKIQKILRETTPWVEAKDNAGRPYRTRDPGRESFLPAHTTDAWHEDEGNAHYILGCELLAGPDPPGQR